MIWSEITLLLLSHCILGEGKQPNIENLLIAYSPIIR